MTNTDVRGNQDPSLAFDASPLEIVKALILRNFAEGYGWAVAEVAEHWDSPSRPGWDVVLVTRWHDREHPQGHTARIRVRLTREA